MDLYAGTVCDSAAVDSSSHVDVRMTKPFLLYR